MNMKVEVQPSPTQRRANKLLWASWLMVPLVLLSSGLALLVTAWLVFGIGLQLGAEQHKFLILGAVYASLLVLAPLPAFFGVWFGSKAHRFGRSAAALGAVVVNELVTAGIWLFVAYWLVWQH